MIREWLNRITGRDAEQRHYTDAVVEAILTRASGSSNLGVVHETAAAEFSAAVYARALSSATIEPDTRITEAVTPELLASAARALIVRGESVYAIDLSGGTVQLIPASSWDIAGGPNKETWIYRVDLAGPSRTVTRRIPADGIVHLRYSTDVERPWKGIGPLTRAGLSSDIIANIELRLSQEAAARVGYLLPISAGGQDQSVTRLRSDLAAIKGQTALIESADTGSWGIGTDGQRQRSSDYTPRRIGPNPPQGLIQLRSEAQQSIVAACAIPMSLWEASADGTAQREAWRRFLHGALSPLARVLSAELAMKLDTPSLRFDLSELYASDVQGRGRAYASLVNAGYDTDLAARVVGVDSP